MDLDHLIERLDEPDLVEPEGLIETFARAGGGATLGLRIFDADNPLVAEPWTVRCAEFQEFRIYQQPGLVKAFGAAHAAVRQYVDAPAELFFSGRPLNPDKVARRLHEAHRDLAGKWIPFDRYVNAMWWLPDLLSRGAGKVFSGPAFLAIEFQRILAEEGIQVTRLPESTAPIDLSSSPLTMLQVGDSYLIGEGFEVDRQALVAKAG